MRAVEFPSETPSAASAASSAPSPATTITLVELLPTPTCSDFPGLLIERRSRNEYPLSRSRYSVSAPIDGGIESTVELHKPTTYVSQEVWYDVEDGCSARGRWVNSILAKDYCRSPGLPQDATNQHNDGNTQRTSRGGGADALPQPFDGDGEQECGENVSELEKDMLLVFKE